MPQNRLINPRVGPSAIFTAGRLVRRSALKTVDHALADMGPVHRQGHGHSSGAVPGVCRRHDAQKALEHACGGGKHGGLPRLGQGERHNRNCRQPHRAVTNAIFAATGKRLRKGRHHTIVVGLNPVAICRRRRQTGSRLSPSLPRPSCTRTYARLVSFVALSATCRANRSPTAIQPHGRGVGLGPGGICVQHCRGAQRGAP
jgi:hypothetical protein